MLKLNQLIAAAAVTFLVSGPALAHQQHGHQHHGHGHAQEHAEIQFVRAEVVEVDLEHNELVLRHEEIEHLNMAAMTMAFSVADDVDISHLSEGDEIKIKVERQDSDFVIIEMEADEHDH